MKNYLLYYTKGKLLFKGSFLLSIGCKRHRIEYYITRRGERESSIRNKFVKLYIALLIHQNRLGIISNACTV